MLQVLQALNRWEKREFDYGDADCCQFAAFIVKELTGHDYISSFSYDSESKANEIIKSHGDLMQTVSSVLGQPVADYHKLQDGSPVLVNYNDLHLMGIKLGKHVVCLTKNGFAQVSSKHTVSGWPLCLK